MDNDRPTLPAMIPLRDLSYAHDLEGELTPSQRLEQVYDPRFAFELALRYEPVEVTMERFGVSDDRMRSLLAYRPFLLAIKQFQRDIAEKGISFRTKAKLAAEDILDTAFLMVKDPAIPASVRMDGAKSIVKWAELDGAPERQQGQQFNIQINLGG